MVINTCVNKPGGFVGLGGLLLLFFWLGFVELFFLLSCLFVCFFFQSGQTGYRGQKVDFTCTPFGTSVLKYML